MKRKSLVIILIVVGFIVGCLVVWGINISNNERTLRNQIANQHEVTEAYYTKLWEVIQTKAGVADEYAEQFKEIQLGVMEGRYSTGGDMMKWIQEAGVELSPELYKDLMNSIEGERNGFFIEQTKLRDMKKQHDDMLVVFPKKVVLRDRESIEVIILKNVATQEAYQTGTDTSPKLFE